MSMLEKAIDAPATESFWQYEQDPEFALNRPISTRDLISWSYQIARGMDYLASSRKVSTISIVFAIRLTTGFGSSLDSPW